MINMRVIVCGGREWAQANNIQFKEYPAKWTKYRKRAGVIRNQQMIDEGKPDMVVAFPGGSGTKNMIALAKKAHIKTIIIKYGAIDAIYCKPVNFG